MFRQIIDSRWILVLSLVTLASGCASIGPQDPIAEDQAAPQSAVDVAVRFDRRRNEAQFQAATKRWEQGDTKACEKLLTSLLSREPKHVQAKQLLADVYTSQKRTDEALAQWQDLLQQDPDNANYHHSIGQLYDSVGDHANAQANLERAVALDPDNPVFNLHSKDRATKQHPSIKAENEQVPVPQDGISTSGAATGGDQPAKSGPVTVSLSD